MELAETRWLDAGEISADCITHRRGRAAINLLETASIEAADLHRGGLRCCSCIMAIFAIGVIGTLFGTLILVGVLLDTDVLGYKELARILWVEYKLLYFSWSVMHLE